MNKLKDSSHEIMPIDSGLFTSHLFIFVVYKDIWFIDFKF
jgi:hypothetical protein